MIDAELLSLLVCPDTRQPVTVADGEVLRRVNERIARGECENVGGAKVEEPLTEGLLREDRRVLYAVREDIPVMLVDEGIPVEPA